MFNNSKYSNVLTIILVVAIILVVFIIAMLIIKIVNSRNQMADAALAATAFEDRSRVNDDEENKEKIDITGIDDTDLVVKDSTSPDSPTKYKGFDVVATIEIPQIKLNYPVLKKLSKKSLETAVVLLYTARGVNEPGNTVIIGHNYRNNTMFSNLKKLNKGDSIYITDLEGRKIEYEIYNIYSTSGNDGSYITRNTNGKREISLSTCTDDSKSRTIVEAKEKE